MTKILPLLTWRSAICDSDLPSTTRHVALTLSLWMNERGASAFPSVGKLATSSGLSERAVRSHLHALVDAGWLELVSRPRNGEHRGNEYAAATPAPRTTDRPAPLHVVPPTPASDDTNPCTTFTQSLKELSSNSGGGARKRASTTRGTRIPDEFIVTDDMVDWVRANTPDIDWELATKTFVAHWKAESRNAVKSNWNSAWKKWLLKDQAQAKRGPARAHL